MGILTFRRIATPIRALQETVETIAAGDYSRSVPFTGASDETGALARSIDVLKGGASAMEDQRWVKAGVARLAGEVQEADSLAELGERFVSGLVPLLGGGVAAFYLKEEDSQLLRRIAAFGFGDRGAVGESFQAGEGLVGECARQKAPIALEGLPPGYLRISSGLGSAAPVRAAAWPVISRDVVLGVLEVASLRPWHPREVSLLEEVLPVVASSLEILSRNIRTRELLERTQEQARKLEEQTVALSESQEELVAQQEELKATEERTRLILESTADGILGVDTEGRIDFVNDAACRILGFTAQELAGAPSHSLLHHHRTDGSEYPKDECPMFAAYARGETCRIDDEHLWRKDGSSLPVEYGARPIQKDGAVVGAVISFRDITERKRIEEEIRQQNFMADSALDLTKAGYWHVPLDGSGWYNSSERAVRIFGDLPSPGHRYTLDDWMEHVRVGDEAAAKITAENFEAAVAGKIPVYDAIYAYKRPVDGRVVWIHALGHVVKDESGKPADMFGVTQDITEFKRLEDGAARRQGERRGGHQGEVRFPRQHEPRDPHADERHHRPLAPRPQDAAQRQAARLRQQGPQRRHVAAGRHQRHPRFLEDRGRQARHRDDGLPARRGDQLGHDAHRPEGARQGPGVPGPRLAGDSRSTCWAIRSASARS